MAAQPTVVLIGKTNVGKSTFWKRMTKHQALVSPVRHTTRDAKQANVMWRHATFSLIDTGGFDIMRNEIFAKEILERIEQSVTKADVIVFMTDTPYALTRDEEVWLQRLRQMRKKTIVLFNKFDRPHLRARAQKTFFGFPSVGIAAVNGGGTGDALDMIVEFLPDNSVLGKPDMLRLVLAGRTNVGKSTLFNALLHGERAIVHDEHHTTREAQTVPLLIQGHECELVDTAGFLNRPKNRLHKDALEITEETISAADIVCVVTDAFGPSFSGRDLSTMHKVLKNRKSLLVVLNKWDMIPLEKRKDVLLRFKKSLKGLPFVPIVPVSAIKKKGLRLMMDACAEIIEARTHLIEDPELALIRDRLGEDFLDVRQLETNPPRFIAVSKMRSVPKAYADIVEKAIRFMYPFIGTPLIISVSKRPRKYVPSSRTR